LLGRATQKESQQRWHHEQANHEPVGTMIAIPINPTSATTLRASELSGICAVHIEKSKACQARQELSWDRYVRLQAAADAIQQHCPANSRILDAGGYDGALALFLPEHEVHLVDPATTGTSLLATNARDRSYAAVVAIDVLEHIAPVERRLALHELARIAASHLILNYPCADSRPAQELVLALTGNSLIAEHVHWPLPDTDWVVAELEQLGFASTWQAHASQAVWVGQYLASNLAPAAAAQLNRFLVAQHGNEPWTKPLYHLVVGQRA
jgi:hypothetical protein